MPTLTTAVPASLQIDPSGIDRVRRLDGIWTEASEGESDPGDGVADEIVAELKESHWFDVVTRRFADTNPWLYKTITDNGRSLFLDLLPIRQGGAFLDVGSGWGQVALPLSRFGTVFCLDLTVPRLAILREIGRQEHSNLEYICGNFRTFPFASNQFDLILFNSRESISFSPDEESISKAQQDIFKKTAALLTPGGAAYIGVENALGLKYILGAPDDYSGLPNLTYLSEAQSRDYCLRHGRKLETKTWTLEEYRKMVEAAGLRLSQVYACFPDHRIMRQLVPLDDVNAFLVEKGTPCPEHSGFDGAPFDSPSLDPLYRKLGMTGIGQYFCPSYAIVATKPL